MSNTCSFAECERYQLAKGLCGGHYRQQHKGQALRPLRPFYGKAEAYGRDGPCRFNDLPQVRSGEWEPCSKPRDKFGLCSGHAAQHYEKRPIAPLRRYRSSCGFPGCSKPHSCGGYCAAHYWQMRKGGPLRPLNERKGWFKSGTGYIYIHEPSHPNANKNGYVAEHTKVLAEILGRALLPSEEVHHRNGKRDDNRAENLELWRRGAQPPGARVRDLVHDAWRIILLYGSPDLYETTPSHHSPEK